MEKFKIYLTQSQEAIMIKRCTCTHEYQDKKYGKGMRVMNQTAEVRPVTYRCTVCEKEKT